MRTKIEVAELTKKKLNARLIQFHVDRGLIKARGGGSRGAKFWFDDEESFYALIIGELWQYKVGVHEIARVVEHVRKFSPGVQKIKEMAENGSIILITVKVTAAGIEPTWAEYNPKTDVEHTIPALMKKSKSIIVIDAGKIAAEVASS